MGDFSVGKTGSYPERLTDGEGVNAAEGPGPVMDYRSNGKHYAPTVRAEGIAWAIGSRYRFEEKDLFVEARRDPQLETYPHGSFSDDD